MTRRAGAALVVLAAASMSCEVTAPDRRDTYGFQLLPENLTFIWPAERLPVKYFAQDIGPLRGYVDRGLTQWQAQFLYGEFQAERSTDSAGADVRVFLDGGTPPAATPNADPALTACDGSTAAPLNATAGRLGAPIEIRVRWFAGFSPTDITNCLLRVTAHEIGHSLGLFQHSSRSTDLMFGVPVVSQPSTRDRSTAEMLYHTHSTLAPAPRP